MYFWKQTKNSGDKKWKSSWTEVKVSGEHLCVLHVEPCLLFGHGLSMNLFLYSHYVPVNFSLFVCQVLSVSIWFNRVLRKLLRKPMKSSGRTRLDNSIPDKRVRFYCLFMHEQIPKFRNPFSFWWLACAEYNLRSLRTRTTPILSKFVHASYTPLFTHF